MDPHLLSAAAAFALVIGAALSGGQLARKFRLPVISGFLITGLLAGPSALGLLSEEQVSLLAPIDHIALGFIAIAAGSELYLKSLASRLRAIIWVMLGLVLVTLSIGVGATFLLQGQLPFLEGLPQPTIFAVSLLLGVIMVARSPSAAIAIINELRAKGPFTQLILGVTILMDVVVITLFAMSLSLAHSLIDGRDFSALFLAEIAFELIVSGLLGWLLAQLLQFLLSSGAPARFKGALLLAGAYSVFVLAHSVDTQHVALLGVHLKLEPLLACLFAGAWLCNRSPHRTELEHQLKDLSPLVYVAFFTITGAGLELELLLLVWPAAVALFFIRLFGIALGSTLGGILAGEPREQHRYRWMGFVTQAGVGLGLAKGVAAQFPTWGGGFATLMIAVIVVNEMIGPLFFKGAVQFAGESHVKGGSRHVDGVRSGLIFGINRSAFVLARQLQSQGWKIRLVDVTAPASSEGTADLELCVLERLDLEALQAIEATKVDAVISLLDDDQSLQICELFYQNFDLDHFVVLLKDRERADAFQELGALLVHPELATVQLLEHFVRAPATASLFLGSSENQSILELEVADPRLHNRLLREIRMPLGTLVLGLRRGKRRLIITNGHTRIKLGDRLTVVGPQDSLEEALLLLAVS